MQGMAIGIKDSNKVISCRVMPQKIVDQSGFPTVQFAITSEEYKQNTLF